MHLSIRLLICFLLTAFSIPAGASNTFSAEPAATPSIQEWVARPPANYFSPELDQILSKMAARDYSAALAAIPPTLSRRAARPDKSYLLQGLCHYALGDYKSAVASFRMSLQTKPSNSDTLFFLGLSQQAVGTLDPALQSIDESLWFAKHNWVKADEVLYERGLLLSLKPDSVKAIEALTQAAKLNPQAIPPRILLARLQLDSGNRPEAIRLLREGNTLQPNNPALRLELAKALSSGADRKLNRPDIEESVKIASDLAGTAGADSSGKDAILTYVKSLIAVGNLEVAAEKVALAAKRFPGDQDVETLRKQLIIEKEAQAAALKSTPSSRS